MDTEYRVHGTPQLRHICPSCGREATRDELLVSGDCRACGSRLLAHLPAEGAAAYEPCRVPVAAEDKKDEPVNEIVRVPFEDGFIEAIRDERGIWAGLRRMCEEIGVDYAGQLTKLKSSPWAVVEMFSTTGSDGKIYRMSMLRADCIAKWLSEINPAKVAAHVAPKLRAYQIRARDVLAAYFTPEAARAAGVDIEAIGLALVETARQLKSLEHRQATLAFAMATANTHAIEAKQVAEEAKEVACIARDRQAEVAATAMLAQANASEAMKVAQQAKQVACEVEQTGRGPSPQQSLVNARIINDEGAGRLNDAMWSLAEAAARESINEDWDNKSWCALVAWCKQIIYNRARKMAGLRGKTPTFTYHAADRIRALLNEDMRQMAVRRTRGKGIPPAYFNKPGHKRTRRPPAQLAGNPQHFEVEPADR